MPHEYADSIRRVPRFQSLPPYALEWVVKVFTVRQYEVGETLFKQGDRTRGMHIFVDGQAILLQQQPDGSRRQIGVVRAPQYVNQQAIFEESTESATLQAVRPVTALLLTRQNMARALSLHPELASLLGIVDQSVHLHDVYFRTQRENEEVLLRTRRHWFAYIRWMWVPLVILFAFWALVFALPVLNIVWIPLSLVLPAIIAVYLYLEWRNDAVIITDQRVIRITHTILTFSEVRDEVLIESIQEANAEIPPLNLFALILRFGNVELRTAGARGNFTLDHMPNPEYIQELIIEDRDRLQSRNQDIERQNIRADLNRWVQGTQTAGRSPIDASRQQKAASEAQPREDRLETVYKSGSGPASPFKTRFLTDEGSVVYRKHWLLWLRAVSSPTLLILAAVPVFLLFGLFEPLRDLGWLVGFPVGMVLLGIGVVWFYFADWDWRHDYYIVGETNITIINQRPLWLQSENDQVLLKQVDNVVSETRGIMQQLLGYGDVRIALTGANEFKLFDDVANPRDIQDQISRRQQQLRRREQEAEEAQQRDIIGEYISAYHEMLAQQGGYTPPAPPSQPQPQPRNEPPHQQASPKANNAPRAATLRDRNRPPNVPRQRQPSISTGRPYDAQQQNRSANQYVPQQSSPWQQPPAQSARQSYIPQQPRPGQPGPSGFEEGGPPMPDPRRGYPPRARDS